MTEVTVGISIGSTPPGTGFLEDGKTLAGQDVDFTEAVANVLGIEVKTQQASFEAILPALDSGKYDLGVSNFGVTTERLKTITSSPTSTTARASPPARTASSAR